MKGGRRLGVHELPLPARAGLTSEQRRSAFGGDTVTSAASLRKPSLLSGKF